MLHNKESICHLDLGSPRPGRRSLRAETSKVWKKSRKSPRTLGPQKSEKSLGESPKSLEKPVFGLFRDFSDSPRDFFQTFGDRGSEDFFETFFRLLGFRPGDSSSQAGEIPNLDFTPGTFSVTFAGHWYSQSACESRIDSRKLAL